MGFGDWLSRTLFGPGSNKRETAVDVFEYYKQQIIVGCLKPKHIHNSEINLMALRRHVEANARDERMKKRILDFLAAVANNIQNIKEKEKGRVAGIPIEFSREHAMDVNTAKHKERILEEEYARGRNEKLDITSVTDNLNGAKRLFSQSL